MESSRRSFLKTSTVAAASVPLVFGLNAAPVHAAGSGKIKIGLVGCGGRGNGAVRNALNADPDTVVVAVGDAFEDRAKNSLNSLKAEDAKKKEDNPDYQPRVAADAEAFSGFDAYRKVIDKCDVVLLCEVPHFRPISLRYAVEQGKHIFCEKPVAVDGAGIKSVIESAKIADQKKLNVVSGLCWRYDNNIRPLFDHIQNGTIGDILSSRVWFQTGRLWQQGRQPNDTEMLYQVRNWYNFTWLSGDFNVEQAIHSIDKMLWSFGDKVPLSAWGNGGRMVRVEYPGAGDIYDSMAVTFDFGEGRTGYMFCRQINKCYNETADHFIGTKGYAATTGGGFGGCTVNVKGQEPIKIKNQGDMYVIEHQFLFKAIKGDIPFRNDLYYTANSTMAGILARQVCRTGKRFTWQEALDYQEPMRPEGFDPEGKLFVTEGEGENAAKVLKQTDYTPDTVPPTVPDEHGRYKVEIAGNGYLYHEIKR